MRYFYIGATPTIKQRRETMWSWKNDTPNKLNLKWEGYTAEEAALDEAEYGIFEFVKDKLIFDGDLKWGHWISASNLIWCATITAEEMAIYLKDI